MMDFPPIIHYLRFIMQLMIGMPGHPVSDITMDEVKRDFDLLETEIKEADVIFLLTDTRESRWLPTLLGAVHNKVRFFIYCSNSLETGTSFLFLGKDKLFMIF